MLESTILNNLASIYLSELNPEKTVYYSEIAI